MCRLPRIHTFNAVCAWLQHGLLQICLLHTGCKYRQCYILLQSKPSQTLLYSNIDCYCAGLMVDNTYHAGTVRDVAAMNAASSTGYTMTNAATNTSADSQLTVHDFLSGMAQLRDVLDNTNDNNINFSPDTVWREKDSKQNPNARTL